MHGVPQPGVRLALSTPRSSGWSLPSTPPRPGRAAVHAAIQNLELPFGVVQSGNDLAVVSDGQASMIGQAPAAALPLLAWIPALTPEQLGDPGFQRTYGVRANYVAGAMANGIASEEMVIAMAKGGLLGFFGAAGLSTPRITAAIDRIQAEVGTLPYGFNLIHSPNEPRQEQESVDLYLQRGVTVISASAYMRLTPMVVQYRATGLTEVDGKVVAKNHILAKVSREEVALHFLRPAPKKMLDQLVTDGKITANEAALALRIPMADDITAEADSGGHTDNRPLPVLLPLLLALRDRIAEETGQACRVGAAGGLGSPDAVAAAFAFGADYVVTGTVNQACIEAGTSPMVKTMLADAAAHDVGMAPASDMFEGGVQVQVLKRGTLFAMRGQKLYELYRDYASLEDIPADELARIEKTVLKKPVSEVWDGCAAFFAERDPAQLDKAAKDPRHKMALVFRWYLGLSSRWAIAGEPDRRQDCQVWCGPAIGSFNAWTRDTFLAAPAERRVVVVAANLLAGAAAITRARWLDHQGIDAGPEAARWMPRPLARVSA
ncbi:MAG: PfaD family polyunsaturated fatty acid/polyketide biosynthesis protein [Proteobacteria bacterium]|nr:PfaD family polyunsaturated fatty acid/polyketide biosynthesis protein [Pseudomonadota bacterium]